MFDNVSIRKYTLDIMRYCNDPTELQSYYNIINRNISWLRTGVSIDIKWLLPYVKDNVILSFCCGIKFFTKEELKFLMSDIFTKMTMLNPPLLAKSIESRRPIDYTWDMILVCRRNKLSYKFTKSDNIYCLTIIKNKQDIYNFIYESDVEPDGLTLDDSLQFVKKTELPNKKPRKYKKNIHQYLSKKFLQMFYE